MRRHCAARVVCLPRLPSRAADMLGPSLLLLEEVGVLTTLPLVVSSNGMLDSRVLRLIEAIIHAQTNWLLWCAARDACWRCGRAPIVRGWHFSLGAAPRLESPTDRVRLSGFPSRLPVVAIDLFG